MIDPLELKAQLHYSWRAFFARHGGFRRVQVEAMGHVLGGGNVLIVAPAASGKTEAGLVPLLERYLLGEQRKGDAAGLRVLYICATRVSVRELYQRLLSPFESLALSLAMKSGDMPAISLSEPPSVLITTPESTDSLLARAPRLFTELSAIVFDDLHYFDLGVRGDHLRCLLARIERIREYSHHLRGLKFQPLQQVALSALGVDSNRLVKRYFAGQTEVVEVGGERKIVANLVPMAELGKLVELLNVRIKRKRLIFCNTRYEVEQVAAYLRYHLAYKALILVHYSTLEPLMRRQVERTFAEATVSLCVSSTSLALGLDIDTIDEVVLIGTPPNVRSFLQRIGRAARRRQTIPVLCLYRSVREELEFQALLDRAEQQLNSLVLSPPFLAAKAATPASPAPFRLSIVVQQIFSLLKQSPTGAIRMADLRRIVPSEVSSESLEQIAAHLLSLDYLKAAKYREWRPGVALNKLLDRQRIYSNIASQSSFGITVVDAVSGRHIGQSDRLRLKGNKLLMHGKLLEVVWHKDYTFAVKEASEPSLEPALRYHKPPFALSFELAQAMGAHLGVEVGQVARLIDSEGTWLFHFWGELYGELLAAILQAHVPPWDDAPLIESKAGLYLYIPFTLREFYPWIEQIAQEEAHKLAHRAHPYLGFGRFHHLLPPSLAIRSVVAHLNLPRFERLYQQATLYLPPAPLQARLRELI